VGGLFDTAGRWFAGTALACIASVAGALVTQHVYGMQPCPWCVLQRVVFLVIAVACIVGLLWRSAAARRGCASLGVLLALCGAGSALWQHFVAAASASCNLTLADKIVSRWLQLDQLLPDVFEARASCSDAAIDLLGVPYDFWSFALFVLIAITLTRVTRRPR
jgi:disulfide bond formation protein DsbB